MSSGSVRGVVLAAIAVAAVHAPHLRSQDYKPSLPADHPAIGYAGAHAQDVARALDAPLLRDGTALRPGTPAFLEAVLGRLRISADSQMLVFSKTSFQAPRISPQRPRAIYFSDTVAVGYVPDSPNLEVAAVAPAWGPVFYMLSADASGQPTLTRSEACLRCHIGPNTSGVPGLYVGSVLPGPTGAPLRGDSAIITDHRSAFADRWGGWYVNARRGEQPDRANAVASNPADPESLFREARQNLPSMAGRVEMKDYPAATSDIVALMTFEHQTQGINLMTRVAWQARILQASSDPGRVAASALDADVEELVAYLLFDGEAPLAEPIEGVSTFTRTFPERGPRDARGRSLRDFDLRRRLFRYPLSYLIYSAAFDALPEVARSRVYHRLFDSLRDGAAVSHRRTASSADRRAAFEILRDTKKDLPAYWRGGMAGRSSKSTHSTTSKHIGNERKGLKHEGHEGHEVGSGSQRRPASDHVDCVLHFNRSPDHFEHHFINIGGQCARHPSKHFAPPTEGNEVSHEDEHLHFQQLASCPSCSSCLETVADRRCSLRFGHPSQYVRHGH